MRKRFSLIEMLIVMAILAILLSLVMPNLNKISEHSHLIQCKENLKSVNVAVHLHVGDNDNKLPGPLHVMVVPKVTKRNFSIHLQNYLDVQASETSGIEYLNEFICPAYSTEETGFDEEQRIYYRTHISKNSTSYFGYPPQGKQPQNIHLIESFEDFAYIRDYTQYKMPNHLKGWSHLVSELPSHYGTDVNVLTLDGRVTTKFFLD